MAKSFPQIRIFTSKLLLKHRNQYIRDKGIIVPRQLILYAQKKNDLYGWNCMLFFAAVRPVKKNMVKTK